MVACAAAKRAWHVIGVDLTPEMLSQAQALQARHGLTNIAWEQADVSSLPFADGCFSVALTRYSFHHLTDPGRVLSEIIRVTCPRGRIAVADLVLPTDKAAAYDRMERLRDP
jgi:ubiquinone/menaquinone biosynthesis C-methylase UbiE